MDSAETTGVLDTKVASVTVKRRRGAWRASETHVLPENRLWLVALGLMCCVFLAAIDQTIVATALPTIISQLNGGNDYSWVGSAYLLAAAALSPLYGKLSDLIALCGAAQNMTWLIICRAVQGIGGGGILQLVNITIGDIVPLDKRGSYNGLVGATWGVASVVGPLLGGGVWVLLGINLPFGGVAAAILFFFLNLNPHQGRTLKEHVQEFDFIGLALIVVGVVCLLLGFNFSGTSWQSPETISLITIGCVLLVVAGIYECYTTRSAIIPPRLFKTRTTTALLVSCCLHALTFFNGAYYLPLYFQVLGASATGAGVKMLPFSLGASGFSAIAGIVVAMTKRYQYLMWSSWAVYTLGYGLMIQLDSHSSMAKKMVYTFVTSIGCGPLFMAPLVALQASMPLKDMATSTAAMGFVRLMGSTVGIAIGQAVFTSTLRKRLADVPNLPQAFQSSVSGLSETVRQLKDIPDPVLRDQIIQAFAKSVSSIWLTVTPIAGVGFLLSLLVRKYTLKTVTSKAPKNSNDLDVEKNEVNDTAVASEEGDNKDPDGVEK